MAKYQISVARDETDKVDTFRFAWQKLNTLAVSQDTASNVPGPFLALYWEIWGMRMGLEMRLARVNSSY